MAAGTDVLPSRYVNPRRIATGGMGEIYVAEDRVLGRQVAIKLLSERFARDDAVRRRFTREALTAARLSGHPHIVTIFDVGDSDGRPFIVMEYLSGGTLADRVRVGPTPPDDAVPWLKQAAEALDDAHRLGIVHRDVKPANLLLDERGAVHVADFGIARVIDETTTGMTLAGTVLGTAGYLSPEQARGERATAASDVYSLAVVAYELLTGGRPFEGPSATAEAAAHIHEPVPPASRRNPALPREVDAVFTRALSKEPARRYRSAGDFVRALCLALEASEPTRVLPPPRRLEAAPPPPREAAPRPPAAAPVRRETTPPPPAAAPVRRRRAWVPILAAVALAAAALAGVVAAAFMGERGGEGTSEARDGSPGARAPSVVTRTVERTLPGTTVERVTTAPAAPPPATPPPPPAPQPPPQPPPAGNLSLAQARALTDQATFRMRAGDYAAALPLAQRALARLQGTGDTYEGYANYNVGKSLAELGRCAEALPYLERREQLLGPHSAVTAAKRQCGAR